jgi:lipopolysaccharide transport system ATP-binding protein
MSDVAIRVEGLSKQYHIGGPQARYKTLRESLVSAAQAPIRRAGRLLRGEAATDHQETIWALKDVSFQVKHGEVLGIIGRNGAGKSTLLKILSRITAPTEGTVDLYGRVGSLLEVGTGFHPELTGRENIYLNGAILGMKRNEIERKFDEIVAFAELEKFLDTPVKHYSSGMYVRLAFAVAAHLDPEILLVDEVLAVGDAAFQKKCLGKMGEVASQGRTVLFVSHNMAAVQNLCPRSLLLVSGSLQIDAQTSATVAAYLASLHESSRVRLADRRDRRGEGRVLLTDLEILDTQYRPMETGISGQGLVLRLHYITQRMESFKNCRMSLGFYSQGRPLFLASTELTRAGELMLSGESHVDCIIDRLPLSRGTYDVTCFVEAGRVVQDWVEAAAKLVVTDGDFYGTGRLYPAGWDGKAVLVDHRWEPGQP